MKAVTPLTSHLGFWLRMVSNAVSNAFARKLEDAGVTVAEWVILREMFEHDDETTPSQMAETTGLTRGAVSKLITRLLDKGLVLRREDKTDRRYQEIELSAAGRRLVPKLAKIADQNDDEFFLGLTDNERRELAHLLTKLSSIHELKTVPTE